MIGSVCEDAMGLSRLYSSEVYRYWACIIMYVQRASVSLAYSSCPRSSTSLAGPLDVDSIMVHALRGEVML